MARLIATRRTLAPLLLLFALLAAFAASARDAPSVGGDPAIEQRTMELAQQLRCLVCQNQTIADSNADLANDLRNQIRQMLAKGASDDEVRDYMTARYGDFVLYKPPLRPVTVLLWFGPLLLLVGGFVALVRTVRRRAAAVDEAGPTEEEEQRALALLADEEEGRR